MHSIENTNQVSLTATREMGEQALYYDVKIGNVQFKIITTEKGAEALSQAIGAFTLHTYRIPKQDEERVGHDFEIEHPWPVDRHAPH